PGILAVLTAADIPGENDISSTHKHDEPVFATDRILHHGQPLFAVIATTREQARHAAALAKAEYEEAAPLLDVASARAAGGELVTEPLKLERGDVAAGLAASPRRLKGAMAIGGQDHFYLESQIALAIPGEDGDMLVHSSTQHPSEVQHMVASVLGIGAHAVTIEVRRMGGGFGGKETQANLFACVAALAARKLGRPVKLRPDRDDDMVITGKRHDFVVDYEIGFDDDGRIHAVDAVYAARCGWNADLSGPVTDRALFHMDNCYFYPAVRARSEPLRTHTVSNTAFRGFGGPQGMVGAERFIEEVAYATGLDPLEVRRRNLYGGEDRLTTPYHQQVEDMIAGEVIDELERDCHYRERQQAIRAFNRESPVIKRGIALTPVKFGISFTATWYNQAGALVHVYTDGTVALNHGGTEMGQGLYQKVAQVVAQAFGIGLDKIRITATTTGKVPNTSATAASSGSDLNGMAALDACETIKQRLVAFAAERWQEAPEAIVFLPGRVRIGAREIAFVELVKAAYMARVQLSATGFYATPKIHWDRKAGRGHPFYYFAYGAAASEVAIDTLTGEYKVERVDILHDCGNSLNPAIDKGQIEGGFVQGMGWLTTEELVWDEKGRLRTHAPSTYKIPVASDRPRIFNVALLENAPNREHTIHRSKAVGEPPLMLAISVLHALSDAVASVGDHRFCPKLDAPATPERVLDAVERVRALAAAAEGAS
ncbi:MAG: xanthine dehydrogenase molybdopterin binding subunit, partial [Bosea sp.]|nr:xanthine dehydrogenase molybdopterin binding subunit [Bosea sp. (in: a-proteobacteria)]